MENLGIITEVTKDKIKIRIDRQSACGGNCQSCAGCPSNAVVVEAERDADYHIGETVKLVTDTKVFLKSAFIGYGTMVILMVICAVGGYMYSKSESFSVISAFAGLVIGFFILKIVYRNQKEQYKIVKIEEN